MTKSALILNAGTTGDAIISPSSYPATIVLKFDPRGNTLVKYGINGATPSIPLNPGTTAVSITSNVLQLSYSVASQDAKLEWDL
ncbi:MAG: hypothetical protein ACI8ZM_001192 [Crocinitomix sp.]|jgi:hypothetical protein